MTFIEEFLVWFGPWAIFLALLLALTLNAFLFQRAFRQKLPAAFFSSILNAILMFLVIAGLSVALSSPMGCAGLLVALLLVCGYAVVRQHRSGKRMRPILRAWAIVAVSWVLTVCLLIGGLWLGGQFRSYRFHRALAARVPSGFTEVNVRRRVKDMSLAWQEVRVPPVGGIKLLTADENGVWVVGSAVVRVDGEGRNIRRWGKEEGVPSEPLIAFNVTRDTLWYVTWKTAARLRRGSARWEVCFKAGKASEIAGFVATDTDAWLYVDGYRLPEEHPTIDYGLFHFDRQTSRWQPLWNESRSSLIGPVLLNGEVWVMATDKHYRSPSDRETPEHARPTFRLRRYRPQGSMSEVALDSGVVDEMHGPPVVLWRLLGSPSGPWVLWERNEEWIENLFGIARVDWTAARFSPFVCTYLQSAFSQAPDFLKDLTYIPLGSNIGWAVPTQQSVWFGWGSIASPNEPHPPKANAVLRYDFAKRRWTMLRGPVGPAATSSDGSEIWIAGENSLYRCRLKDDTWQKAALPLPAEPLIAVAGSRVWVAAKDGSRVWRAKVK